MKILILTPITIEYNGVRKQLIPTSIQSETHAGLQYEIGQFQGSYHNFEIVISRTGSRNTDIALATEKAIQQYNPVIVILTGIAGGVKDVKIGDIVVANKMYGYESGKETEEGFVSRPEVFNCSMDLVGHAEKIGQSAQWKYRSQFSQSSNVLLGPIISGDKVISSTNSVVYQRLKKHFNDTLALEMEASGFGKVMLYHPYIKFINVRGVSDLLDDKSKTDGEGGQEIAVANAVAFVFELLFQLNYQTLNLGGMINSSAVIANATPKPTKEVLDSSTERIHDLIEKNKIKSVLELMLPLSKIKDEDLHHTCLLLANRWNRLMKERRDGTIGESRYDRALNKIIMALISLMEELGSY